MPISGLVITFHTLVEDNASAVSVIESIPEVELGDSSGHKLAIVVDSANADRDREIWNAVQQLPEVAEIAVALIGFEDADDIHEGGADTDSDSHTEFKL